MAKAVTATKKNNAKTIKKPVAAKAKALPVAKKKPALAGKSAAKKAVSVVKKKTTKKALPKKAVKKGVEKARRYRCRLCGYIYSTAMGEPHNGIPRGTAFDDLPDTYVCPVCGFQGKGKIGKWGFDEWLPTRYLCSMCDYIYDEKRGEPHRGIKPGTKFEDLPEDYVCPVCATDPKIRLQFGKVFKQGFSPLNI